RPAGDDPAPRGGPGDREGSDAMRVQDRWQAGRGLGRRGLREGRLAGPPGGAPPRGGGPGGAPGARALPAPPDAWGGRQSRGPGQPEAGMGAVAADKPALFDQHALDVLRLTEADLSPDVERARVELHRREHLYRGGRSGPRVEGRTVVLVDDGLATGVTARAA